MIKKMLAVLIILGVLGACTENRPEIAKIMPYELSWEIQAGLNSFETHFWVFENERTNQDIHFNEELSLKDISAIKSREARLEIRANDLDLMNIESVEVFLSPKNNMNRELEAFYTLPLRPNERNQSIRLIPSLTDLKDIYNHDRMKVTVRINFFQATSQSLPVRLTYRLEAQR